MAPKHVDGHRSGRAAALCCLALATCGAILLTAGLTQRSAPQAAPLPPASTASSATWIGPADRGSPPAIPTLADKAPQGRSLSAADRSTNERPTTDPRPEPANRSRSVPATSAGPDRLSIPVLAQWNIAITAATETTNHILKPPADVHTVGIWTPGAPLAATDGTTDIVGHVNYAGQGPGALHDIAELHPGDRLYTTDDRGRTTSWTVTTVFARSKNTGVDATAFPGPAGPRQLVLITCGGSFDPNTESYLDNVYVRALPTPSN